MSISDVVKPHRLFDPNLSGRYHVGTMSTRVVILAAGKGKRMGASIPKPLVSIAGKPMIQHLIKNVADSGMDKRPILIVAPDGVDLFRQALGDVCEYAIQAEQKGTGHAVAQAEENAKSAETIIVLYGDHPFLSPEVIRSLGVLKQEHGATVAMLTVTVPNFEGDYATFEKWGRILRGANGEVIGNREFKDATDEEKQIRELNPCMYAFDAAWLWEHLKMLTSANAAGEYYLTDVIAMAMQEGRTIVTASGQPFEVVGVNTPEELQTAERLAK